MNSLSGFLRRNRKQKKKSKAGKDDEGGVGSDGEDVRKSETPTPEVDDEGFSKQPPPPSSGNDPWSDFNQAKNFDSSSDESEDDKSSKDEVGEMKPSSLLSQAGLLEEFDIILDLDFRRLIRGRKSL